VRLLFKLGSKAPTIVWVILAQKTVLVTLLILVPVLLHTPSAGKAGFHPPLTEGDTEYYLHIATHGYDAVTGICAFYPLWPACIRMGSWLTGGNTVSVAWLLANIFSSVGLLLFHRLVWEKHNLPLANRATMILLVYPGAVFFFFPYSESLFLLLLMTCLLFMQRKLFWGIAVAAFFLPLARPIGIFILPVLIWELFVKRAHLRQYAVCLAPVIGYFCYFGIIYYYKGNPFEGFTEQMQFPAQPSILRIVDIPGFVTSFANFTWSHDPLNSFIDRAVFIAFLLSLYWVYRLDTTYYIFALLVGLIPAMSNIFMSYTRFSSLIFPLFIVWAQFTHKTRILSFVLMLFFSVQILFLLLFISGKWAG
jgi:hypothetical protein